MELIHSFRKLYQKLDEHTLEVVKKSASSSVVKVFGMVMSFLVSIFLARTIGAEDLGIISIALQITNIVIVLALFGMSDVIIKNVSIFLGNSSFKEVNKLLNTTTLFTLTLALFLSFILIISSNWIVNSIFENEKLKLPLIILACTVPPIVISRNYCAGLIGYRKIWQSNLLNNPMKMGIVCIFLTLIYFLPFDLNVNTVSSGYLTASFFVLISAFLYWRHIHSQKSKRFAKLFPIIRVGSPLLFVSLSYVVMASTDLLILGWLTNATQVGLYSIALKIAILTSFFLQVSNSVVAPKVAELYHNGNKKELENMVKKVTGGLILIGIFFLSIYIIFGKFILSLWGPEFVNAYLILIILSIGQCINLSAGAVGVILVMTGFEKVQSKISIAYVGINIILNYIFILYFGIIGAAIATSFVMAAENITKFVFVRILTGITTFPFTRKAL